MCGAEKAENGTRVVFTIEQEQICRVFQFRPPDFLRYIDSEAIVRIDRLILIGSKVAACYTPAMQGETTIAILRRVIDFNHGDLSPALAEAVLKIQFAESDQSRLGELAVKCNQGNLTADEADEYDGYIAAADLLSLWKSKARSALKPHSSAA